MSRPGTRRTGTEGARAASLDGKVAIVTGSGRGLGLAYARELAHCRVPPSSSNDVDAATATDAVALDRSRRAAGPSPSPRRSGSTRDARQKLVSTAVEAFGRLDILVTNAGVLRDTVLWKMSDDDFDTVINVHLRRHFHVRTGGRAYMREQGADRGPHHLHRLPHRAAGQFRSDQLRGRQGRHRRHGAHVGTRAEARRHHRQRRHPRRRHRDDGDCRTSPAAVEADAAGEPMPASSATISASARRTTWRASITYLASDAAADVTRPGHRRGRRSAAAVVALEPVMTAYHEGGWSARRSWRPHFRCRRCPSLRCRAVGESFPPLPDELQR